MAINHNGALTRALGENRMNDALASAEKLARYQPLDAAPHIRVGFVAYLAGRTDQALAAFARARQLTLPDQFKTIWTEQSTRAPGFRKVAEDKALVAKVFGAAP
jgi:tetratricopeptide (TPR) repeat protein